MNIRDSAASLIRTLPDLRGRGRVAETLDRFVRRSAISPFAVAPMRLGHRLKLDLRALCHRRAFYTGEYDTDVIVSLCSFFERDWIVLDVGANVGFYSVPFAKKLAELPGSRLICFEPVPANAQNLRENLDLNSLHHIAKVIDTGLSDSVRGMQLTLREEFASGSATGNAAILIEDGQDDRFSRIEIQVDKLDNIWPSLNCDRVDFIKVDIEGHEDAFIRGAENIISRYLPIIYMEINEPFYGRRKLDPQRVIADSLQRFGYVPCFASGTSAGIRWKPAPFSARSQPIDNVLFVPGGRLTSGISESQ
jgi:FkbM family methyltransferase